MLQVSTPALVTQAATAQAVGNGVVPVDVSVVSTPTNIDQLLRLIQISGSVTAPPDNGIVTLATALGNFSFSLAQVPEAAKQQILQQLDSLFQNQKSITAVMQPGSPPMQAVLLLPSSTAGPQVANPISTTTQQPFVPQTLSLLPGATYTAVVLPPDIVVPGAVANLPGTTIAAAPVAPPPTPPQAGEAPTNPPPQTAPQLTAAENSSAGQNTAASPAAPAPATQFQPGKVVVVQIDAVALPSSPPPTPTAPNQIAATVIGNGANGQLIAKTADDTTLYVRANVEAPVGTNLLIKIEAPKPAAPTLLPPVDTQNFSALQQTLSAIAEINPQLAQQIIESRVPQPNLQLTGPLLFFLSALKQGDAKGWLGKEATEALMKAGKFEIIQKLAHELQTLPQKEHDPAVGDWKSYPVPMHLNGQFQSLTLRVHADGRGASAGGAQGASPHQVRFLIDVRMSRLGPLQLDGLVRPKKLDMIVRSESALPPGLPQELRSTYLNTIEALGYTGSLSFQTGRQHWLAPRKETPQSLVT